MGESVISEFISVDDEFDKDSSTNLNEGQIKKQMTEMK